MAISDAQQARRDRRRERHLLLYYQPGSDRDPIQKSQQEQQRLGTQQPLSPDTTLTAFAQLAAFRLDCSRSLISVIGRSTQYVLAESTRSLSLTDDSFAAAGDALWHGCGLGDKSYGLCEATVNLSMDGEENSVLVVPDLTKHETFKNRPYITGPPYWKFYAGAPLRDRSGVNIGSICVLDDAVKGGLSGEKRAFMTAIADTVMRHLEMRQEAQERKKVTRMSRGLKAFVQGKPSMSAEFLPSQVVQSDSETPGTSTRIASAGKIMDSAVINRQPLHGSNGSHLRDALSDAASINAEETQQRPTQRRRKGVSSTASSLQQYLQRKKKDEPTGYSSGEQETSQDEIETEVLNKGTDRGLEATFVRAASLLREALNLHDGSVLFYDTVSGISDDNDNLPTTHAQADGGEDELDVSRDEALAGQSPGDQSASKSTYSVYDSVLNSLVGSQGAKVLGSSFAKDPEDPELYANKHSRPVSEKLLKSLLKRYPQGKLWLFDDDGSNLSAEDELSTAEQLPPVVPNYKALTRKGTETKVLQLTFPGVRQLLFVPLWDAGQARWFAGCFCFSISVQHVLWSESELSFLTAYSNSVMAEVSRLATIAADQQKGDFIGSISHELRSPLHGILASAEFLAESDCNAFQMSLIDTVDSCGRTLLDTINHVLDFSKINSFERSWRQVGRGAVNSRSSSVSSAGFQGKKHLTGAPPLLNIYAVTDVAAICEEVIEGVWAGQVYSSISSSELTDVTAANRGRASDKGTVNVKNSSEAAGAQVAKKPVDIVLDVSTGNYIFTTQPGAIRRVIMNVAGNALKYTDHGLIEVVIGLRGPTETGETEGGGETFCISIKDTGKGISNHYLRTRLFTPFAQENSLAPGTGLGLSIVRGIVNMLGGSIRIESELGVGTHVQIAIPMKRPHRRNSYASRKSSSDSLDRVVEDSVSTLKVRYADQRVGILGFEPSSGGDSTDASVRVLKHYLTSWYSLRPVSRWSSSENPQVVIVDEKDAPNMQEQQFPGSSILILCSTSSTYSKEAFAKSKCSSVEILLKPFGPYKLAKTLKICFEKAVPHKPDISFTETVSGKYDTVDLRSKELQNEYAENLAAELKGSSESGKSPNPPIRNDLFKSPSLANATESRFSDERENTIAHRSKVPPVANSAFGSGIVPSPPTIEGEVPSPKRTPSILLVEDNDVNLRLLRMFMLKRKYGDLGSAENGQLALETFEKRPSGYDIIFMDISMPIMNGFEATRAIRSLERDRRTEGNRKSFDGDSGGERKRKQALIVALTGLASSRDQDEAYSSGIDLFMTKPVSFKEVGRLLDNWEKAQEDEVEE